MFPEYDTESVDCYKVHWTNLEIVTFLREKADYLRAHSDVHDGLVVIMASQGKDSCVWSSDHKKIPMRHIQDLFSMDSTTVNSSRFPSCSCTISMMYNLIES